MLLATAAAALHPPGAVAQEDGRLLPPAGLPSAGDPFVAAFALVDRLSPFIRRAASGGTADDPCGPTPEGYFACFDPAAAVRPAAGSGYPAIQARKLALRAIALYTQLLDDFANGRDLATTLRRGAELELAMRALAGLAGLAGPVPGLVGEKIAAGALAFSDRLAESRSEERFRQAVLAGHPAVAQLIDLLIADTANMYELYKAGRAVEIIEIQNALLAEEAGGAATGFTEADIDTIIADINAYHGELYSLVVFLAQLREALTALAVEAGADGNTPSEIERIRKVNFLQRTARMLFAAVSAVAPRLDN